MEYNLLIDTYGDYTLQDGFLIRHLWRIKAIININSSKVTNMKLTESLTDATLLSEIGQRLTRRRLDLQLSQAQLAQRAGLSKRTVERIEAGKSTQVVSLLRILRELGLLDSLDQLLPADGPRPLDLLKLQGKQRRRASAPRKPQSPERAEDPWRWGEDE